VANKELIFDTAALKYTIFFFSKRPKIAKWQNHFISGKPFQKRPNLDDFAFKRAKWQPRDK